MDQVKDAMAFVWKHRFWFGLGLAVILGAVIYPTGSRAIFVRADQRRNALEGVYKKISDYTRSDHPNMEWKKAADTKVEELTGDVNKIWESMFLRQRNLFEWPKIVVTVFGDLAFGDPLDFDRNQHLSRFRREGYATLINDIYMTLDPLRLDDAGRVKGKVDSPPSIVRERTFGSDPTSEEAWLAMEELWIQKEVFRTIAQINASAKEWRDAPVRRLSSLELGALGLGAKARTQSVTLTGAFADATASAATPSAGRLGGMPVRAGARPSGGGYSAIRYSAVTEQYRDIPISLSMLVDQMKIPVVLAGLTNMRLRFTMDQVEVGLPRAEVELPRIIQQAELTASSNKDVAVYSTLQMDVWGKLRIYKMPNWLKKKPGESAAGKTAESKDAAAPAKTGPAAETKPAESKPADSKSADAKSADAKSADTKALKAAETTQPPASDAKSAGAAKPVEAAPKPDEAKKPADAGKEDKAKTPEPEEKKDAKAKAG